VAAHQRAEALAFRDCVPVAPVLSGSAARLAREHSNPAGQSSPCGSAVVEEPLATAPCCSAPASEIQFSIEMPPAVVLKPHHHSHVPRKSILKAAAPCRYFDSRTLKWVECKRPTSAHSRSSDSGLDQPDVQRSCSERSAKSACSTVSFADQHGRTLCKVVVCANLQYSKQPKRSLFSWFK